MDFIVLNLKKINIKEIKHLVVNLWPSVCLFLFNVFDTQESTKLTISHLITETEEKVTFINQFLQIKINQINRYILYILDLNLKP